MKKVFYYKRLVRRVMPVEQERKVGNKESVWLTLAICNISFPGRLS